MGNCQAIDAATLVIQHPSGKVDRLYWPVSASEVMRTNPGHYVALLISSTLCPSGKDDGCPNSSGNNGNSVRLTRIKLLRPTDTLVVGQVYRLITTQEVMKGLWAKKCAKMKKNQGESAERVNQKDGLSAETGGRRSEREDNQVTKHERHRPKSTGSANPAGLKSRTWQPSLQSISEAAS